MSRQSRARALRVLAAEVEAGTPLPAHVANTLVALERDPEVRLMVEEELEDERDVAATRRALNRGVQTIPHAVVKRELGR